jgi:methyl-accepting chemotaxis protein
MKTNFRKKLIIILALIGLFPLLISGIFQFYLFSSYLESLTFSNLEKISKISSNEIENYVAQSFANVKVLSNNLILISEEKSPEEKLKEINRMQEYYGIFFQDITVTDDKGIIIASNSEKSNKDWGNNYWFSKSKKDKNPIISDIYTDLNSSEPVMAIFHPILEEDETIKKFIIVQINTQPLFNSLSYEIGENGGIILVNRYGDIIFHVDKNLIFEKISANYPINEALLKMNGNVYFDFLNEKQIANFQVIQNDDFNFGWQLIAYQPMSEAFGILHETRKNLFLLGSLFLIITFSVSLLLSRKITNPLKKLSSASKEISHGNFEVKANVFSNDEFGELAKTFNTMTKELNRYKERIEEEKQVLEIKVIARTRELEIMNKELEEKIKERTKEIEQKLIELERINKLMIGRELKMIELKKELKDKKQ